MWKKKYEVRREAKYLCRQGEQDQQDVLLRIWDGQEEEEEEVGKFLHYAHRHRSIFRAAGHFIHLPVNQLLVTG
jgi:hypothetical protein